MSTAAAIRAACRNLGGAGWAVPASTTQAPRKLGRVLGRAPPAVRSQSAGRVLSRGRLHDRVITAVAHNNLRPWLFGGSATSLNLQRWAIPGATGRSGAVRRFASGGNGGAGGGGRPAPPRAHQQSKHGNNSARREESKPVSAAGGGGGGGSGGNAAGSGAPGGGGSGGGDGTASSTIFARVRQAVSSVRSEEGPRSTWSTLAKTGVVLVQLVVVQHLLKEYVLRCVRTTKSSPCD